jgi:hypothetical protein
MVHFGGIPWRSGRRVREGWLGQTGLSRGYDWGTVVGDGGLGHVWPSGLIEAVIREGIGDVSELVL